jgi:hypothetical protein
MSKTATLAAIFAAAFSAAAAAPQHSRLDQAGLDASSACPHASGYSVLSRGRMLAGLVGQPACPLRPEIALEIARAAIAEEGTDAAEAWGLLGWLTERGIGVPRSEAEAREHHRRAWLLGYGPADRPPFAGAAEIEAYLARPQTIAFLRRHVPRAGGHARLRLARALLARGRPSDRDEARRLLAEQPLAPDGELRLLSARMDLAAPDPEQAARGLRELRSLARLPDGIEARSTLAAMARRRLGSRNSQAERLEAMRSLAIAALAANSLHRSEFMLAVVAANGGLPPPLLSGPEAESIRQRLRLPVTDEDYPAAAMRAEEVGRIAVRGLIDPAGRLIFTEPLAPGQPPILLAAVRRMYSSRTLPTVDLGRLRTAPYMWIELPGVVFTIRQ